MIETIKRDFLQGLKNLKFWAQVISERVKIELNILRLVGEINKLSHQRDEIFKKIGKEVSDIWGSSVEIKDNEKIATLVKQIRELEVKIEEKKKQLSLIEDTSK